MTEEKKIHEGTVEFIICCRDEGSREYMNNTHFDQEQLEKYNIKEDDRVQYTVDKDNNAVIIGKIHIEKTIEKLA